MPTSAPTPVVLITSIGTFNWSNASSAPDISVMAGAVPLSTMPMRTGSAMAHLSRGWASKLRALPMRGLRERGGRFLQPFEIVGHVERPEQGGGLGKVRPRLIEAAPSTEQARIASMAAAELRPAPELLLNADGVELSALRGRDVRLIVEAQRLGQDAMGVGVGEAIARLLREANGLLAQDRHGPPLAEREQALRKEPLPPGEERGGPERLCQRNAVLDHLACPRGIPHHQQRLSLVELEQIHAELVARALGDPPRLLAIGDGLCARSLVTVRHGAVIIGGGEPERVLELARELEAAVRIGQRALEIAERGQGHSRVAGSRRLLRAVAERVHLLDALDEQLARP